MGLTAAIIAVLGGISAVLGVVNILQVPSQPIFSDKLTWTFWMALAVVLLLLPSSFYWGANREARRLAEPILIIIEK